MVRKKTRRRKISFRATKRVPKKVRVSFTTRKGKKVSFIATRRVPKRTKVEFYAKKRKERK